MTTEEILQTLNEKFGTIQNQDWFVSLQKTAHSKNITTAEWNSLLFHAARTSSDTDTLKTCLVQFMSRLDNVENGSKEGAVQQIPDGVAGGFEFNSDKNPNAVKFDPSLNDILDYGATGNYAASFGGKSAAMGKRSHSEGTTTIAKGAYSHAEGDNAVALGDDSHAEGYKTTAYGEGSHAEGNSTVSEGKYSHAEGWHTTSEGEHSHAEGGSSIAKGEGSHAEGKSNTAQGVASHAEGIGNVVEGKYAHAEGSYNKVYATSAHAEGLENTIDEGAEGAHTSGRGNHAKHAGAQLLGRGLVSGRQNQTVVGQYNRYDDEAIFIVGTGTDKDHPANSFAIRADGTVKCIHIPRTIRLSLTNDFRIQARLYHQASDEVDANPGLFPMAYSNEIDLPLETMIVDGYFDEANKDLKLTLKNGTNIAIPLDNIIAGLASEADVKAVDDKTYYDHIITTEADFRNIGNYSGRVLVKDVVITASTSVKLASGTQLEFLNFSVAEGENLDIDGNNGTVKNLQFFIQSVDTFNIKNFSRVEGVKITGDEAYVYFTNCQHISNSHFSHANNCSYIDNCYVANYGDVTLTNCKYICGIETSSYSDTYVHFSNCSFISNVNCMGTYENCTYVDAESCKGFVPDEDVGKVQVLTNDGTFQTAELLSLDDIADEILDGFSRAQTYLDTLA